MSPLARSLLALACAALFSGACATKDGDQCTTLTIGKTSPYVVYTRQLGPETIHEGEVEIDVLNQYGIEIADEVVTVCVDVGQAPIVTPTHGNNNINVRADSWDMLVPPKLTMTVIQHYKASNIDNSFSPL